MGWFPEALRGLGAEVTEVAVYRLTAPGGDTGLARLHRDSDLGYVDGGPEAPGGEVGDGHPQLLWPAVVIASWLSLAGGASIAAPAQQETCSPNGTALSITAFDSKFDKRCLAAPAGQAFTIDFSNLDRGIPHNLAIYEDQSAQTTYFKGELVDGPGRTTYSAQGLSAGTYFFRCDPHPEMNGTFIAG